MRRVSVVLFALSLSSAALAEAPPSGAVRGYRLPPALVPSADEAPSREPDDVPRRRWELSLDGSAGVLGCAGNAPRQTSTPDPCAHLQVSTGGSFRALSRPIPHLAIGVMFGYARFGWDASHGLGSEGGDASWTHFALAARGYLFDAGTIEPWVGSSIGGGWLAMHAAGSGDELWRNGIAMTGSLGVDVWVSGRLRVGPFGELVYQPGSGVERCHGGTCLDAGGAVARIPDHAFRLGIGVTAALGDEL